MKDALYCNSISFSFKVKILSYISFSCEEIEKKTFSINLTSYSIHVIGLDTYMLAMALLDFHTFLTAVGLIMAPNLSK